MSSSRQARGGFGADASRARRVPIGSPSTSKRRWLPPTCDAPKRKRWPVSAALSRRACSVSAGEADGAGGESDAGADRRDVVEVVPDAFELEQDRCGRGRARRRGEAERVLARLRVGDAVGDGARGAGPCRRTRAPSASVAPSAARSRPAVLVEQPRVEVEDAVADDVEAEVAGLDDTGVDRADRDLVGVVDRAPAPSSDKPDGRGRPAAAAVRGRRTPPRTGRGPPARPTRPRARGRRSRAPSPRHRPGQSRSGIRRVVGEQGAHVRAVRRCVEVGEAPALRRAPPRLVPGMSAPWPDGHVTPSDERLDERALPGSQKAATVRRDEQDDRDAR